MRTSLLDGSRYNRAHQLHSALKRLLDLPDYYGENLDALYDCLTELHEDTCVGFFQSEEPHGITEYLNSVKHVMRDAEEENPHFAVIFGSLEENFE